MPSLMKCKDECGRFFRNSLPTVSRAAPTLPTLPKFCAIPNSRPNRYKFVEERQPNWWQLPSELRETLFGSVEARALGTSFEETPPFSQSIGKRITVPERGSSSVYASGLDVVREIFQSYLFAAGCARWNPSVYERVWRDCLSYFNPVDSSIEYCLYAPIANMPGNSRRLNLGDGLLIRRLTAKEIAHLASLDPTLAGVSVFHRRFQWPVHFFVKKCGFKKISVARESDGWLHQSNSAMLSTSQWSSRLNEEVAILRSLLNEHPAVPTYALIRDGHPREPTGGPTTGLPWRVRLPNWIHPPTDLEVKNYAKRRSKFLKSRGEPGWENVAASMRRFSVAWENPFRADILADVVAALEELIVREKYKVEQKLRNRSVHLLAKGVSEQEEITNDLSDAYGYRSTVFHGGFVFDQVDAWETASRLKADSGKDDNPFDDVNKVHRLIYKVSNYYRRALEIMIDRNQLEIDWKSQGL